MQKQSNYDKMQEAARKAFLAYDLEALAEKPGVQIVDGHLETGFFGQRVELCRETGHITLDGRPANFSQALSIYDWLCDGKTDAKPAGEFCSVGNLPGVYVRGSGLSLSADAIAPLVQADPEKFCQICEGMAGRKYATGDICYAVDIFPGLPMCLKFYFGDEEFAPSLSCLWDKNILQFVRYETVYYIENCLEERLTRLMGTELPSGLE